MKTLLGSVLMAIGILIGGASGICSIAFLFSGGMGGDGVLLILLVGGIPFAIGVGLFYAGRALVRSDRAG